MKKSKKTLLVVFVATLLLNGCGREAIIDEVDNQTLNGNNYIKVAKNIYANPEKVAKALPPQATVDPDTIYINKIQRPRDYKITNIEAIQGDKILTISIGDKYKYATITLVDGASQKQQKVNLKDFTIKR